MKFHVVEYISIPVNCANIQHGGSIQTHSCCVRANVECKGFNLEGLHCAVAMHKVCVRHLPIYIHMDIRIFLCVYK